MTSIAERTVLFADLRGSTGLYESMGNTRATRVVTDSVARLCSIVDACRGRVVKTLGDGLMATFADAERAVQAASRMHEALDRPGLADHPGGDPSSILKLQIALARGEVVEMGGDCFGDAVNVAARLLDLAGDNEVLATAEVIDRLDDAARVRFRSLDRIQLRGRAESVHVHLLASQHNQDFAATTFGLVARVPDPEGIRLSWLDDSRIYSPANMPVILGRSPQATHCIDDARVSRLHARIDWHGGTFQYADLSYNGSFVRFDNDPEIVTLRRGQCTLHGSGVIGLGSPPTDPFAPSLRFEVLRFAETQPHDPCALERGGA
ncbi:MAG: FHA domain-containing protein [Ideonella sp.]|nr:FHA domain-containing protein [Ideonella sp.]